MIGVVAFTTSACTQSKKDTEPAIIHYQVLALKNNAALDPMTQIELDAAEHFNKLNPSIQVVIDYMPETPPMAYSTQDIIKILQSNQPQDIVPLWETSMLPILDNRKLLLDLNDFLSNTNDKDINQRILDNATINGKLLLLPNAAYANLMMFNKELFDAAQVPYPQGDWTWEQFREISKKIKPSGPALSYDLGTLDMLMGGSGKKLLSTDGKTAIGYLDSPEAVSSLKWLNSYYHDNDNQISPLHIMDLFGRFDGHKMGMLLGGMGNTFLHLRGAI
ncbi:ABC transporter substrate-binding protein [Paenibacillus psychroresistens]|nr:extracellular solute-binding protein [Paenibacillus psychroresistens]